MQILLWLVPAALATVLAMLVAGWFGREQSEQGAVEQHPADYLDLRAHPDESVSAARPMRGVSDLPAPPLDRHRDARRVVRRDGSGPARSRRTA